MTEWVAEAAGSARHRARLFCFPFAGGTARAFAAFSMHLPDQFGVCPIRLPGRDGRPPAPTATLEAIAEEIAGALLPLLDRPFALFGHSLGALLAFEVALRLEAAGRPPGILYASASRPPGDEQTASPEGVSDDELIRALIDSSAAESGLADAPALQREVLPLFRWDLTAAASYQRPSGALATCPVVALGGVADPSVDSRALLAWRAVTAGAFRVRRFPGDHFYAFQRTRELLEHLRPELERLADSPAPRARA